MAENEVGKTLSDKLREVIERDGTAYASIDENGNLVFMTSEEAWNELTNDLLGNQGPQSDLGSKLT